jgi:hypothetical protein
MENPVHQEVPTPPGCFRQDVVILFQSFGNQVLAEVNYFLWLDVSDAPAERPYRFLYALELIFAEGGTLLLSSGEDSEAIQVITAEALVATASRLQALHGKPTLQRLLRSGQGVWEPVQGKSLTAIQLAPTADGLYSSDALMLDFGATGIIVELPETGEGLEIRAVDLT